jgi:hypothetical protein
VDEPQAPEAAERGFLQYLPDLYFAPGDALSAIHRKPAFWIPLAVMVALALVFTAVWTQNVDLEEFMRTQIEESGQGGSLTADQVDQAVEMQMRIVPIMSWVGAVLGSPILVLVSSAVFLFVFRFFFGSAVGFKESMAVTAHSFMTVSLLQTPLILLTLVLKGNWNLNPQEVLSANLTLLLEKGEASAALWSLAGSLDLFSFWTIFLLAVGFGIASKRSTSSAAMGVLIPWVIVVAIKVGFTALTS